MRLNVRLKKTLVWATLAAVTVTAMPTTLLASDYENHWAKAMIEKWSQKDVIKGYADGSFKPNHAVTRGELAALLVRVFGLREVEGGTTYTDVIPTKWYAGDVAKVSAAGIMYDATGDTFRPEQAVTRQEAAYAIARAYRVATQDGESHFTDQAQISEWAEDEIAALVAGGYLSGNPDGSFRPQAPLTRAEAVAMIHKITSDLVNIPDVYAQDVQGNLVVNTTGVELKDMTITGNLYLAPGIGEGEVKLTNVTVVGDVIVEGGSTHTIKVEGQSKLNNILVDKAGKNPVRLLFGKEVEVSGKVTLASSSTLEGSTLSLKEVVVEGAQTVQLAGGMQIGQVTINQTTKLVLADGPKIQLAVMNKEAKGTVLSGTGDKGSIEKMAIYANDIELSTGFKFDKNAIIVGDSVTPPKLPNKPDWDNDKEEDDKPIIKQLHINKILVKQVGQQAPIEISTTYGNKVNTIQVVVNTKAQTVTINGHTFTKDEKIEFIKVQEAGNLEEVKVILPGVFSEIIDAQTAYKIGDVATIVNAKEESVLSVLDLFKKDLGNQYATIQALLTNGISDLNTYVEKNNTVEIAYMTGRAERVRSVLAKPEVEALYSKIDVLLERIGVSMAGLGTQTPSIGYKLSVTGAESGYETDEINLTVNYQ